MTTMPRCATCVHWKSHVCVRVTDSSEGASIDAELYEDWAMKADPATLITDADFGCVLHQAVPE